MNNNLKTKPAEGQSIRPFKAIVAVSLEEETHAPLLGLKDLKFLHGGEIHLVHVVPIILYARGMSFSMLTYPMEEERPRIKSEILSRLDGLRKELLPQEERVVLECLFGTNEKATFTDYVTAQKANLVIVATRGKRGIVNFFDSSFAQHQVKYAPTNVLVLR